MQLIYPIDIFEDNYNIARVCFEKDSVNVMKNMPLVAKKQRKSQCILAWFSLSENHENQKTRNSNTQNVRKPFWFVTNS